MSIPATDKFKSFCMNRPHDLNSLRLFDGWISRFPDFMHFEELSAAEGVASFPSDERVIWGARQLGGFSGKSIIELGPMEGYNTAQFEYLGASSVLSIEASVDNFLKCLVVKNIFGLKSRFLLGDGVDYLLNTNARFDVAWASGLLYHLTDPIRLLQGLALASNNIFIWTQYYDHAFMGADAEQWFIPERNVAVWFEGREIVLHFRTYRFSEFATAGLFAGGEDEFSYWMEKDDIMYVLDKLGFGRIVMGVDNPNHGPGPACFFIASRTG